MQARCARPRIPFTMQKHIMLAIFSSVFFFSEKIKDLCKLKHFARKMGKSWLQQSFAIWIGMRSGCWANRTKKRVHNESARSCAWRTRVLYALKLFTFFQQFSLFTRCNEISVALAFIFFEVIFILSLSFIVSRMHRFNMMFSIIRRQFNLRSSSMLPHTHRRSLTLMIKNGW